MELEVNLTEKVQRLLASERPTELGETLARAQETHAEMEDALRREASWWYSLWADCRDWARGLAGEPPHRRTPEELFGSQLRNLRHLGLRLEQQAAESEALHADIASYAQDARSALERDCHLYRSQRGELATLVAEAGETPTAAQLREAKSLTGQQSLAGQRILFRHRELGLLDEYERMLASAAHHAASVGQQAAMVNDHLQHVRRLYGSLGSQSESLAALTDATGLLGAYLGQLNRAVSGRALELSERLPHPASFPDVASEGLSELRSRLHVQEYSHHAEIEDLVAQVLADAE